MADATLKMLLLAQDRGASKAIKGVGDQADRTAKKSHHMGAAFAKAGKLAALGLGAGLAGAGAALVKMTKGAAADEAAQKRLAVGLKNSAGATKASVKGVESWISKVGVATGVTDDELRPSLDRLARSTHSVGLAQKLTRLAMDASAGTGKSLESVSNALAKAHDGSTGALGKLGIATKDASGKALTFDQITKNMAQTFKGQATAHANTLEGKMSRLKLVLSETGETIGGKLIPILTTMSTWFLEKALPAIQKFFSGMQSGQGVAGGFSTVLKGVGAVVQSVAKWIGTEFVPFVKDLADRFRDAMGGTAGFKKMLKDLQPAIVVVKAALSVLWAGIKIAARVYIPALVGWWKILAASLGMIGKLAIGLWNHYFQPALRMIVKGFGWVIDGIAAMLRALGHIKGFGWATRAADSMDQAADKARRLADNIRDIPKNKKVTVTYTQKMRYSNNSGIGSADKGSYGHNAVGTRFWKGGATMVGERGRAELVDLPRGSRITPESQMRANPGVASNGHYTIDLRLEGKVIQSILLKEKRRNGGTSLGLA